MTDVTFYKGMTEDGKYEVRVGYTAELMCPNPREAYMRSRTYEQMRAEYDLLHIGEVTEEDLMRVAANMSSSSTFMMWLPIYFFYGIILSLELYLLFMMLHDMMKHG